MKKLLALFVAILLFTAMITPAALAGKADNSVVINIGSEPPQMNSILTTDTTSLQLLRHLMEGLVDLDANNKPVPGIAESWTKSEDGLTYTFTLRKDAVWQDGVAVTAKDFEFAFFKLIDSTVAAEYASMAFSIVGAQDYFDGKATKEQVGYKVIDDSTIEIKLVNPVAYFESLMAFAVFYPVRQDVYEANMVDGVSTYATEAEKFMANGPFTLESWAHESEIVLVKNPTYYGAADIKLDKIVGKMINDAMTAYNMFTAGDLDMVGLSGATLPIAAQDGKTALQYKDGATFYLQFNHKNEIVGNANIRRALSLAIDRASFTANITRDNSVPALTYTTPEIKLPSGEPFASMVKVDYKDADIEGAKVAWEAGLKELGLTGEEAAAKITLIADDSDVAKEVSAAYQEYWRVALGVTVTIENMPFKSRLERTTNKEFSIVSGGWGPDYDDALTFLDILKTGDGNNKGDWSNAEYDALILASKSETDSAKRLQMLADAETIMLSEFGVAPVYFRSRNYLLSEGLKGVVRNAFQDYCFNWASFE